MNTKMNREFEHDLDPKETPIMHPHKFALRIAIAGMIMFFGGLTSAYLVRKAAGNWLEFDFPNMFFLSTAFILLSSLVLQESYKNYLKLNTSMYRQLYVAAFLLGIGFVVCQFLGFKQLSEMGVFMYTNPSGGFLYVLVLVHMAHLLGGLVVLMVGILKAFKAKHVVNKKRKRSFELTLTYWHFVDILWLFLLVFLSF